MRLPVVVAIAWVIGPGCIQDEAWAEVCIIVDDTTWAATQSDAGVVSDVGLRREASAALVCAGTSVLRGPTTIVARSDAAVDSSAVVIPGTVILRAPVHARTTVHLSVEVPVPPTTPGAGMCTPCGDTPMPGVACAVAAADVAIPDTGRERYVMRLLPMRGASTFEVFDESIDAGLGHTWPCP